MKTLIEYILESLNNKPSGEKFEYTIGSVDDLFRSNVKCIDTDKIWDGFKNIIFTNICLEDEDVLYEFKRVISDIYEGDENIYMICAPNKSYFKIPYRYKSSVIKVSSDYFYGEQHPQNVKKAVLYFLWKGKRIKIAEIGAGSVGRVTTANQETATCFIYNTLVAMASDQFPPSMKKDLLLVSEKNIGPLKDLIYEISNQFSNDWIISFIKQISSILSYLKNRNLNYLDYVAIRYGEPLYVSNQYKSDFGGTEVSSWGKKYATIVKAYLDAIGEITYNTPQKDHIDPADIILFNTKSFRFSISTDGKDNPEEFTKKVHQYWTTNVLNGNLVPISLKQVTEKESSYEIFNIDKYPRCVVSNIENINVTPSKSQIKIIVNGKFNFSGLSLPDGKEISEVGVAKKMCLTFRSFGNNLGMDVGEMVGNSRMPSLGKIPVRSWISVLNFYSPSSNFTSSLNNLRDCVNLFERIFKDDSKETREIAKGLIEDAIKIGVNCLPFILVH